MSASPDPRREQSFHRHDEPHADDRSPGPELPPDVLSEIVAQTASNLASAQKIDPTLHAAIVEVARRFAGQPMTVEPAGTALLEAVLRIEFPTLAERPPLLTHTARTVATSLLADPAARLRVEHLWATLAEDAA